MKDDFSRRAVCTKPFCQSPLIVPLAPNRGDEALIVGQFVRLYAGFPVGLELQISVTGKAYVT